MKIILDTDIGDDIDDAFALQFLISRKEIELLGVTTVYKNVEQRAKITKNLLKLANRENIPVHSGINKPLRKDIRILPNEKVEENGLINIDHYTTDIEKVAYDGKYAVEFILNTIKKYPNEVIVVAIGPLTNIAQAIKTDKETFSLAKEILLMGGRFNDKKSEWNIEIDPEAARIVYESGVKVTSISFDATIQTSMTKEDVAKVNALTNPSDRYLAKMMNRWIAHDEMNWVGEKLPLLHDVLAVATLVDESVCKYEEIYFSIPLEGENKECTLRNTEKQGYFSKVGNDINKDKFFGLFRETIFNAKRG